MPAVLAVLLLCACVGGAFSAGASGGDLVTLEWLVVNSDLVVRGRILECIESPGSGGQVIDVQVVQTLKGPSLPRVKAFSEGFLLDPLRDRGAEVLLCLRPWGGGTISWETHAATLGEPSIVFLEEGRLAARSRRGGAPISADLRPLNRPAEVLEIARAACTAAFTQDSTVRYELYPGPWAMPLDNAPNGPPTAIRLPVGAITPAVALTYAKSSRPELRALALEVLFYRGASERSRSAVKAFLTDPAYRQTGDGPWAVKRYLIRERACELLTEAGVNVPHPVTEGTLALYRPIRWGKWLALAATALALLVAAARTSRRRASRSTSSHAGFSLGFALAALLIFVIGYAWITSRYRTAEIVLTAGSRHRLASYRGGAQYMFVRDWPEPRQLVAATFDRHGDPDLAWEWAQPAAPQLPKPTSLAFYQMQLATAQNQLALIRQDQTELQRQRRIASTYPTTQLRAQIEELDARLGAQIMRAKIADDQFQFMSSTSSSSSVPFMTISGTASLTIAGTSATSYIRDRTPSSTRYWLGLTYVRGQLTAPDGSARPYTAVRVAYPWLLALPAFITLASLRSYLRRRRRIARGQCAHCGYDLRASRDRCPECGTPMPGANPTPVMDSAGAPA
jgi:hypothetical protein